jgi:hypothetical protein
VSIPLTEHEGFAVERNVVGSAALASNLRVVNAQSCGAVATASLGARAARVARR